MFEKIKNLFGTRRSERLIFTRKNGGGLVVLKSGTAFGEKSSVPAMAAGYLSGCSATTDIAICEPVLYGVIELVESSHSSNHCSSNHDGGSSSSCDSSSSSSSGGD